VATDPVQPSIRLRADVHAALGDPARLAIVDDLALSDRSVSELGERFGLAGNLLAHHLGVLESAGVVDRLVSAGDRRRRYVRLRLPTLEGAGVVVTADPPRGPLFVCTHNSARSQLAAGLWSARTGLPCTSAGTRPANDVHPQAVAAARRVGLDLRRARPRRVTARMLSRSVVVTVCDLAHEELVPGPHWWHWSIRDPIERGRARDFDAVVEDLDRRMAAFITT
jgi:ArsR family transcriptional regulator, arsenate/arsenite/antimonite-responsive transcriptional repressor / arsenate reductase (thioredoxin)